MSTVIERRPLTLSFLALLIALVLFILAECAAQGWLTKGSPAEWFIGGFIAATVAKLV